MNFGQNLSNKVFCRMFGLVVMEGMTLSGHLSNIDDFGIQDYFLECVSPGLVAS